MRKNVCIVNAPSLRVNAPSLREEPLIEAFLAYLKAEKGRTDNTVAAYRRDLSAWAAFMTGAGTRPLDAASMTVGDLRTWLASLGRSGMEPTSMRRKVQALRAFFNYLMVRHGYASNPAAQLKLPRPAKPLPVFVRQEETMAMLADADEQAAATPAGSQAIIAMRDALILDLLYTTGLRVSELTDLLDADADTSTATLRVMGKGRKERLVPFGKALAERIDAYRAERDTLWGPPAQADPLLLGARGGKMNRRQVYAVVNNAMRGAGVHASRMSPHVLRHSCATDLLRHGADLDNVRTLLGHANLAATQIYTHITDRELRDAFINAHPRARKDEHIS